MKLPYNIARSPFRNEYIGYCRGPWRIMRYGSLRHENTWRAIPLASCKIPYRVVYAATLQSLSLKLEALAAQHKKDQTT